MSAQQSSAKGYATQQRETTHCDEYNLLSFIVEQMLSRVRTAMPVRVVAVSSNDSLSPVGTVDVQPLVKQMDGARIVVPLPVVHDLPYFRLQGGTNAIVIDPKVGDIGLAVCADRDISTFKATRDESGPGSLRQFDLADGLYVGGFLNEAPTQVLQFTDTGINVISPGVVNVQATTVNVQAAASANVTAPAVNLGASICFTSG